MILKKRLGQNLLIESKYAIDLVKAAKLTKDDVVLEIGSGTGNVTKHILPLVKLLYAVELDPELIPHLKNQLSILLPKACRPFTGDNTQYSILNTDVLQVLNDHRQVDTLGLTKLIGAIPYQITSPLIHLIVNDYQLPTTLLVQKEVAERITAKPPHATYLSNFLAYWGTAEIVEIVPNTAFDPVPEVDGAILILVPHATKPADILKFSKFLHLGFSNPRKMLNKVFPKELLLSQDIDPSRRAETLTLEEWIKIYKTM